MGNSLRCLLFRQTKMFFNFIENADPLGTAAGSPERGEAEGSSIMRAPGWGGIRRRERAQDGNEGGCRGGVFPLVSPGRATGNRSQQPGASCPEHRHRRCRAHGGRFAISRDRGRCRAPGRCRARRRDCARDSRGCSAGRGSRGGHGRRSISGRPPARGCAVR